MTQFKKKSFAVLIGFLFLTYSLIALKERRWNVFVIGKQKLYAPKENLAILESKNICVSDLTPVTRSTHEKSFCSSFKFNQDSIFARNATSTSQAVLHQLKAITDARFRSLQNPETCSQRKLLVCDITAGPGFGSLMHLLSECFLVALGTNRTMVMNLFGLWYGDLEKIFSPIASPECTNRKFADAVEWKGDDENCDDNIVKVTILSSTTFTNSKFLPFNVPKSIADPLQCHHGNPNAWWIGQIVNYFMRLQPNVADEIRKAKDRIGFSHPIVGLHIRRTDKNIENIQFHHLESYIAYAARWYDCNYFDKGIDVTKKVYIATDDPSIITEAKKNYQDFVFLHDPSLIFHSTFWWNRFSKSGMLGLLTDVELLKECDFFIGTFSSNLGRLVYELRQTLGDRTYDSLSLDWSYNYHRGYNLYHVAVENHSPLEGEMELKIGDEILNDFKKSSTFRGYYGLNLRTRASGFYQAKTVRQLMNITSFASFPAINKME